MTAGDVQRLEEVFRLYRTLRPLAVHNGTLARLDARLSTWRTWAGDRGLTEAFDRLQSEVVPPETPRGAPGYKTLSPPTKTAQGRSTGTTAAPMLPFTGRDTTRPDGPDGKTSGA